MNENTPDADQSLNQDYGKNPDSTLLAGSAENDTGTAARFERGEIDVFTLVSAVPESALPPSLRAIYQTAKQAMESPQLRAISDANKRERESRNFLNQLGLWRLARGAGYVQAYEQFERTGKSIEVGQKVFESDWFRQLQDQRAREIAALEEKQRAGRLTPAENDRRLVLKTALEGDNQVKAGWQSLSDKFQKIKARENTGNMDEKDLREKEAQLKQRLFDQLDKASTELRERLLAEISSADPSFLKEYEDRLKAQHGAQPLASSRLDDTIAEVRAIPESVDSLIEDVVIVDRPASTAKAQGIAGVKTGVDMNGAFVTAVAERVPTADAPDIGGPDFVRTGKHLTSNLP
jgi:hypothetical protein